LQLPFKPQERILQFLFQDPIEKTRHNILRHNGVWTSRRIGQPLAYSQHRLLAVNTAEEPTQVH
jgi:hypothetical protein